VGTPKMAENLKIQLDLDPVHYKNCVRSGIYVKSEQTCVEND